tara:strand:- start:65 stop:739 length:675 start_codon:yes stop_codon:yes gene_type:complete
MSESLTITSIFLLGCLHALEPGHGKTFLLAYTVGEKLDFQKIVLLTLSLLISHFFVLTIIAIIFNLVLTEVANSILHEFSHWLAPGIIISFGSYIILKAMYKTSHIHSDDCGHDHGNFQDSKVGNPITVGILTGILPCASSLAVVMMTGMTPSIISIIRFILIYVLGIALILFLIVLTFNFTKNIVIKKFNNLKININQELLSGCLILGVGFIYLVYNVADHSH